MVSSRVEAVRHVCGQLDNFYSYGRTATTTRRDGHPEDHVQNLQSSFSFNFTSAAYEIEVYILYMHTSLDRRTAQRGR